MENKKKKKKISAANIVAKNKIMNLASTKNLVKPKLLTIALVIMVAVFVLLIGRLFYWQFFRGDEMREAANRQQTTNRIISPKRGDIYDSTGKILATSAQVDTISVNPTRIVKKNKDGSVNEEQTVALKEKVAKALSDIFTLNYEEVLEKIKSEKDTETIVQKVEKDKVDQLRTWMEETEISVGINIDDDVKRYYPYNTVASNLIGFCTTDNVGLLGLEAYWDEVLTGTPGKIVSTTNVGSDLIPDKDSTYVAAENGSNLTLTVDITIQSIAEKYLKQAVLENDCKGGGNVLVMNPSTGDVLAMATYPDYNLNTPFEPNETYAGSWTTMSSTERSDALNRMWSNKAVSYRYEPGSTYKMINASVGLEEGIVDTDTKNDFICTGYQQVADSRISCANTSGHGSETMRQALMNSCNPALIQLGQRIGAPTLYRYYEAYGLFHKTGIQTLGEVSSLYWDEENVGPVQLATMSFGQRFTITPIQLITAVSAIANDGILMKPRIVKQIENTDTGTVTTIEPESVRQVISKDTSEKMINMLESVVSDGGGKYGKVTGYTVAGKTGTSEPNPNSPEDGYVASFVGIAPAQNPEVVVLVILYNPQGKSHLGGTIAAPVVSQILSETLPYLGIPSDTAESVTSSISSNTTSVPDVRNKTIEEAKNILTNAGFKCKIASSDTSAIVTDQVPKPGIELISGSTVCIYSSGNEARVSQEVPNLKGKSLTQAIGILKSKNLNIHATGNGVILTQDPMSGTSVEEGTVINVTLQQEAKDTH